MNEQTFFFRHKGNLIRILIDNVIYLQAEKNYVRFCSATRCVLVRISMDIALAKLPEGMFVQTNRSYAVALEEISSIHREGVTLLTPDEKGEEIELPVSKQYYKELMKKITILGLGGEENK